jgi:hypothetical protein
MVIPPNHPAQGVDATQHAYWHSPVSRLEVQQALDDYTRALMEVKQQLIKLDFVASFLLERLGAKPAEIEEFMQKKVAEMQAQQQAQEQQEAKA